METIFLCNGPKVMSFVYNCDMCYAAGYFFFVDKTNGELTEPILLQQYNQLVVYNTRCVYFVYYKL